jgi:hypothetical protein
VNVPEMVARAVQGCTGIVHLAAVSRVVWALLARRAQVECPIARY